MENKDKIKARNQKFGEYFLNMSVTTFGTFVLGSIVSAIYSDDIPSWVVVSIATSGLILTISFAGFGDKFLKK